MQNVIFVIGSITTASRFRKIMEKLGCFSAEVIHTPSEISGGSCSYSVRAKYDCLVYGLQAAKDFDINIRKIYREIGERERTYDDIS